MGPLWAWVVLWLLSAYGLVILLRRAMMRSVGEPVPVLVATPPPAKPELSPGSEASDPEHRAQEASVEAVGIDPPELVPMDASPDPMPPDELPEREAIAVPLAIDDFPSGPATGGQEAEDGQADAPWIKDREALEASEPWSAARDLPEAAEPWAKETAEAGPSETAFDVSDELEPIVYRAIDLESLTLGLQSSEIQGLYGPPGHMSKVGEDGEQWRYPLNATDDRGEGLEGVLMLEFQRGRLVRKALEQVEAESGGA